MRNIREVLRLKWHRGLSNRQIAKSCAVARSTVGEYIVKAKEAELCWPLPEDLDDTALERVLYSVILLLHCLDHFHRIKRLPR